MAKYVIENVKLINILILDQKFNKTPNIFILNIKKSIALYTYFRFTKYL